MLLRPCSQEDSKKVFSRTNLIENYVQELDSIHFKLDVVIIFIIVFLPSMSAPPSSLIKVPNITYQVLSVLTFDRFVLHLILILPISFTLLLADESLLRSYCESVYNDLLDLYKLLVSQRSNATHASRTFLCVTQ